MTLDVDPPDPPSLRGSQPPGEYEAVDTGDREIDDDYRRDAVADALQEGAWRDAFEEWAASTDLSTADFERAVDLGLIDRLDFYWNESAEDVGYHVPSLPENAEFSKDADDVASELDDLGRVVSERLENDYLRRDENDFGLFPDEDDPAGR